MIPVHDVVTAIDVDEAVLKALRPYEVVNGFAAVRDYQQLIDITWDEAAECVEAEARWIERAAASADATAFDDVLDSAPDEDGDEDDVDWLFRYTEVGAAGLVFALSAAGYVTFTSCRGHAGLPHARAPQVGLGTEPDRLRLLVDCAGRAGCGVETDNDGLVWVVGRSVADLHTLARLLLDERSVFDSLAPSPWRHRAEAALEHGEDFDWDDSEIN